MVLTKEQTPKPKKKYLAPAVRTESCAVPNLFACTPNNPIDCGDGTCVKDIIQC